MDKDINDIGKAPFAIYSEYWLRGWWAILLTIVLGIASKMLTGLGELLIWPLRDSSYAVLAAIIAVVFVICVIVPIYGFIFEKFAQSSERISHDEI